MNTEERRNRINEILRAAEGPISASSLAATLSVSRQVIVGDIAILRAAGINITATPRGYIFEKNENFNYIGIVACKHDKDHLLEELYTIVDYGGYVIDVTIEHSLYGQINGMLDVASRYDADMFMQRIEEEHNEPLSSLTGGIHNHRIGCRDKETFDMILKKLKELKIAQTL